MVQSNRFRSCYGCAQGLLQSYEKWTNVTNFSLHNTSMHNNAKCCSLSVGGSATLSNCGWGTLSRGSYKCSFCTPLQYLKSTYVLCTVFHILLRLQAEFLVRKRLIQWFKCFNNLIWLVEFERITLVMVILTKIWHFGHIANPSGLLWAAKYGLGKQSS